MSNSVRPHRRQATSLHRPWDSPGKNTGVGCRFLLQCMKVKSESEVAQWCPTLRDPMDCSLPGSSIHGIFQARVLEYGAIAFSNVSLTLDQMLSSTDSLKCQQYSYLFKFLWQVIKLEEHCLPNIFLPRKVCHYCFFFISNVSVKVPHVKSSLVLHYY